MANEYFQPGSVPAPNSPGASAIIRNEFSSVAAGFDKLPILAGHANELISVDATGTKLVTTNVILTNLVTLNDHQTLTNKTIPWASNTFPGFDANDTTIPLGIGRGGTGATDLAGAQSALGIDLKAPINNPVLTGAPMAPTPPTGDSSARLATTFFVTNTLATIGAMQPGDDLPKMDGTASAGTDPTKASRQDHVHPSDTSRAPASAATAVGTSFTPVGGIAANNVQSALAELDTEKAPLASPALTGTPTAPTVGDSSDTTTKIATTAWVQQRLVQLPVGVQVSDTPPLMNGTAAAGTGVEASRWDHVHPSDTSRAPASAATAAGTSFTPAGTIAATTVQEALEELDEDMLYAVIKTGANGAAIMPTGPTSGRPGTPLEGYFRRNSQLKQWEGYDGTNWSGLGGASGGGGNPFVYENDIHVTADYTITTNKNGMSAGPIIVDNGVTVQVPNGSTWTVV